MKEVKFVLAGRGSNMIFLNPQYFRSKIRANKKVASSELKSRGRIYSVFEIREHGKRQHGETTNQYR